MVKYCFFKPEKRCFHNSCSIFDHVSGNISLCPLYSGNGCFSERKSKVDLGSIFSKRSKDGVGFG